MEYQKITPIRPIVCTIGSPTYSLAKELARILSPMTRQISSYIKNSAHFVERESISERDQVVNFDVQSLFTKVPVGEAIGRVAKLLEQDETLIERTPTSASTARRLTELCLHTTYFEFEGDIYEQKEGAAMGSPLWPVLANTYMETFEEEAIDSAAHKPSLRVRYVDDTFVMWPRDRDKLQGFFDHPNSRRQSINFTMEEENAGSIPFLDVLNQLTISVYRKKTSTNRYRNFDSYHHPRVKVGIIHVSCLHDRAGRVCCEVNIHVYQREPPTGSLWGE